MTKEGDSGHPGAPGGETEVTLQMVKAAAKVLRDSGMVDHPIPGADEITVRRMLQAALKAGSAPSR